MSADAYRATGRRDIGGDPGLPGPGGGGAGLDRQDPVRASSMAMARKIRLSVRAPTVIWVVAIQWPSEAPKMWLAP